MRAKPRLGDRRATPDGGSQIFDGQEWTAPDTPAGRMAARAAAAPRFVSAAELQGKTFPPVRWVVPDLIPQGLTILAGKPKLGKSWLSLDVALSAARGGWTLGDRRCIEGDVLYAALEDGEPRLKSRMAKVCQMPAWPGRLTFCTEAPNLTSGGLDFLQGWAASATDPRLIIVDTFAKVRPTKMRDETQYEADYRAAGMLKGLADETGVAVVMVHHVRKQEADDPFDTVSGTNGLTGAADTILILRRESGGVTLCGRGRDIEEFELAVQFQKDTCRWRVLGDADELKMSNERRAVMEALRPAAEPLTIAEVAALTGHSVTATKKLLFRMFQAGELQRNQRGRYSVAGLGPG